MVIVEMNERGNAKGSLVPSHPGNVNAVPRLFDRSKGGSVTVILDGLKAA